MSHISQDFSYTKHITHSETRAAVASWLLRVNIYVLPLSLKESICSPKIYLQKNRFLEVKGPQIHINLSRSLGHI